MAEERKDRKRGADDEEHLAAARCKLNLLVTFPEVSSCSLIVYRPNLKTKSDTEILREAKLEALGLLPEEQERRPHHHDRPQMATDEMVRVILYVHGSARYSCLT